MSKLLKALVLALVLCAQISFGGDQLGTGKAMRHFPGGIVEPFGPGLEVVSYAKNTGQLSLKFSITYFPDAQLQPHCDTLMMTVYPFDGLTYTGPETLLVPYQIENPYSTLWELTLPPNDTSYLIFREECGDVAYHYGITFVTTGDTLVTRWESGGRDRELAMEWTIRHWPDPREDYERAKREWEERQEQLRRFKGKSTRGHGRRLSPEDSARLGPPVKGMTLDSLHKLEEKPLTDYDAQLIQVGDTMYIRSKGEYRFRLAETNTDREELLQSRPHLKPEDWSRELHIVVDLRDSEDYDFVSKLVDSLIPMEKPGYYHMVTTLRVIDKIKAHRIDYVEYPRYPGELVPPPKPDRKEDKSSRKDRSSTEGHEPQWDLLFDDGFEGDFPGPWTTWDNISAYGYDYWGKLDTSVCTPSWGDWAVWCAGVGDMTPGSYYDNYMGAIMEHTNGIDIQGFTHIDMEFDLMYSILYPPDEMEVWVYLDGVGYRLDWFGGGDWQWRYKLYSFEVNHSTLRPLFWFYSDAQNVSWGAYIDEVRIWAEQRFPNLTYDTPPFWDYPIVPSSETGTNTVNDLYGGEPTYIDWSIVNWEEDDAGPFHVGLYLDGDLLNEWYFFYGLDAYEYYDEEDYETTISTGYHTLKLWVDNRGEVQESNESDNIYERGFWWDEPEITYTGHVYFWDMNPQADSLPARYVTIKLWDKDGTGYEQLGADFTDQNGYFQIGPVPNNNDTQDKDPGVQQDISFSIHADIFPCEVRNTQGEIYQHTTPTVYNHRSGVFDTTILIPTDSSGAFFVADVVLQGWDSCNDHSMYLSFTPVYLDAYDQTEYVSYPPPARIRIDTTSVGWGPDTWDRDIILHEYGHRVADFHDFFFSDTGVHAWDDTLTLNLASTEGWAHFFAAWVTGDPLLENNNAGFTDVYTWNCENGEWAYGGIVRGSANNYGKYTEGAVAGILWDIFDYNDDDYSWWTGVPGQGYQDGIGDTLWNGIDTILMVLLEKYVNGHHPDNIDEFWQAWRYNWFGHLKAMVDIRYEHGEPCCNTDGMRGDFNYDGAINMADLGYLVNFLFFDGPAPPCLDEGDCNDDGGVNMADLTYLVDYLVFGGPPPAPCP